MFGGKGRAQLFTVIPAYNCSKDWLSTFCATPIAAYKEQKGIDGANQSTGSSSRLVYKDGRGGKGGKSRQENKRWWDRWELPKILRKDRWCVRLLMCCPTAKRGSRTYWVVLEALEDKCQQCTLQEGKAGTFFVLFCFRRNSCKTIK